MTEAHTVPVEPVDAGEDRTVLTASAAPVILIQFPDVWGRNVSPFGLKLEAWLRLADIPYTIRPSTDLRRAPKGKLPYIQDGGRLIADSTLIIEHLKATRGIDPDAGLSRRERAETLALQRLFEEHLYFALAYSRWIDEAGWRTLEPAFFGHLTGPLRWTAGRYVRRRIRRMLHLQGLGRHRAQDIYAMARADLQAAADFLGDRPFFMGNRLTTIDAVAYGFIANIVHVPFDTELQRITRRFPTLLHFCEAMEHGLRGEG